MTSDSPIAVIPMDTSGPHSVGHLYLLREREFVNAGQPVYKVGKTRQENGRRFWQYPKDSVIELVVRVADSDTAETEIKRVFDGKFIKRTDIGSEYYEGDRVAMMAELARYIGPIESKEPPTPVIDYKPAVDALTASFYPIFYAMHINLSFTFMEQSMRALHAKYGIDRVYTSGGRPEIRVDEPAVVVDVAKFMKDMKKAYGTPARVSAEQWQKYVGAHNALCRLQAHVATYEQLRAKLPAPMAARFFAFKIDHMVEIDAIAFNTGRLKCHDFKQNGRMYETYPWQ